MVPTPCIECLCDHHYQPVVFWHSGSSERYPPLALARGPERTKSESCLVESHSEYISEKTHMNSPYIYSSRSATWSRNPALSSHGSRSRSVRLLVEGDLLTPTPSSWSCLRGRRDSSNWQTDHTSSYSLGLTVSFQVNPITLPPRGSRSPLTPFSFSNACYAHDLRNAVAATRHVLSWD